MYKCNFAVTKKTKTKNYFLPSVDFSLFGNNYNFTINFCKGTTQFKKSRTTRIGVAFWIV